MRRIGVTLLVVATMGFVVGGVALLGHQAV
jgi:hypothetical protein